MSVMRWYFLQWRLKVAARSVKRIFSLLLVALTLNLAFNMSQIHCLNTGNPNGVGVGSVDVRQARGRFHAAARCNNVFPMP